MTRLRNARRPTPGQTSPTRSALSAPSPPLRDHRAPRGDEVVDAREALRAVRRARARRGGELPRRSAERAGLPLAEEHERGAAEVEHRRALVDDGAALEFLGRHEP